jgi:hypothetical protein
MFDLFISYFVSFYIYIEKELHNVVVKGNQFASSFKIFINFCMIWVLNVFVYYK